MTDNFNQDIELQATSGSDDEFDGLDIAPSNAGKKRQTILIAVLAVLLLGGGGFFAYSVFLSGDDYTNDFQPPAPLPVADVPAPVDVAAVDPNAPPVVDAGTANVDPALPPDVAANPLPASAPDVVAAVDAATVPAVTDTSAPTAPAANAPATIAETIDAVTEAAPAVVSPETVAAAPLAVPAPSDQQLQPIDPNATTAVIPDATAAPAVAATDKPMDKNAATAEAVKEILGTDAVLPTEAQNVLAKQVEVTPHIKQVIVVHKTYSANSGQAINAAGDRVLAAGQYGNAISIFDRQLKQNPSDPMALSGKANALQKTGRDAEAMAVYQHLLDLNPRDLEALTNYLGILQKQKPEEALNRLNALAVQYPESGAVSGQLAMTQATLMDTPAALKSFQKAIALEPANPIYPFNMGVLFDRLGTTDQARDAYRRAIEITRQYPETANVVPVEKIRQRLTALSN